MSAHPTPPTDSGVDEVIERIASYAIEYDTPSDEALATAHLSLLDALGCGLLALRFPECAKLLGPLVPGVTTPHGARVPGCSYVLDPVTAAFDIGAMIRWLDFNDTWLAAEWGHPSDNLGGILALADYLAQVAVAAGREPLTMRDTLVAMIKAHEIQGVLALENSFNRAGMDHTLLVRVATAAVASGLLGGSLQDAIATVSNAWVDGGPLRVYRHAPDAGPRKSWAAGDATSRGVRLALMAHTGEPGYIAALTAPEWGFQDALFRGRPLTLPRSLGCYVMENVLFKARYPAEFHAQTGVECGVALHPLILDRFDDIERIEVSTQESAIRIISKTGPLRNHADRDHCLQYMVAVALLKGDLTADDYEDAAASDPRIDALRERMRVTEDAGYSREYLDPNARSIANAVQVFFRDGSSTPRQEVRFPLGHRQRRAEAQPFLEAKFTANIATRLPARRCEQLLALWHDPEALAALPVHHFMSLLAF